MSTFQATFTQEGSIQFIFEWFNVLSNGLLFGFWHFVFNFFLHRRIVHNLNWTDIIYVEMPTIYSCSFLSFKSLWSLNSSTISTSNCCKYLSENLFPPSFGLLLNCRENDECDKNKPYKLNALTQTYLRYDFVFNSVVQFC